MLQCLMFLGSGLCFLFVYIQDTYIFIYLFPPVTLMYENAFNFFSIQVVEYARNITVRRIDAHGVYKSLSEIQASLWIIKTASAFP